MMRYLLLRALAALVCLGVLSLSQTSAATKPNQPDKPNFSSAWVLARLLHDVMVDAEG